MMGSFSFPRRRAWEVYLPPLEEEHDGKVISLLSKRTMRSLFLIFIRKTIWEVCFLPLEEEHDGKFVCHP
jgi:hypothetical protein